MSATTIRSSALSKELLVPAIADAFRKLSPRAQVRNPVMFVVFVCSVATTLLWVQALNVMHLATPASAILSAVIFNALIIMFLIPLALKGVKYRALGAGALLRRNLLVYGIGGMIVPFIGIKLIDMLLVVLGLA